MYSAVLFIVNLNINKDIFYSYFCPAGLMI